MDLIAELEGIQPPQRKKWAKILDAFSALAFAIAPLHSTVIWCLLPSGMFLDIALCLVSMLSRGYCKCHRIDCGCCVKRLKLHA